jgi:hypothetical protein
MTRPECPYYSIWEGCQQSFNTGEQRIYLHFKSDNWNGCTTIQRELDKLVV